MLTAGQQAPDTVINEKTALPPDRQSQRSNKTGFVTEKYFSDSSVRRTGILDRKMCFVCYICCTLYLERKERAPGVRWVESADLFV